VLFGIQSFVDNRSNGRKQQEQTWREHERKRIEFPVSQIDTPPGGDDVTTPRRRQFSRNYAEDSSRPVDANTSKNDEHK